MRLLILSCNTGEGHNSAAKAIKSYFEMQHILCDIKDALAFWSPEKSKIISKGHVFLYRNMPKLFGASYRFEENHPPKDGDEGLIYELVIKGCDTLNEFLNAAAYDGVICTHVFSAMMMSEIKKRKKSDIKTYFVATDYTCSPGVDQTRLDAYFIPHEKLIDEFCENGIPRERIIPSGIPVRPDFYEKTDKISAKKALSLPCDKKMVLLMCGSMGCGPMKTLAETLPFHIPSDTVLAVICGSNKRLYKSLTKYQLPDNMKVVGFTNRIPLYMDAAEIILTKPGGLSSSEAAVKSLPMLFIDAVPGCETRNYEFFIKNGCADKKNSVYELCEAVCDYLEHQEKLETMANNLSAEFKGCAAQIILNTIKQNNS